MGTPRTSSRRFAQSRARRLAALPVSTLEANRRRELAAGILAIGTEPPADAVAWSEPFQGRAAAWVDGASHLSYCTTARDGRPTSVVHYFGDVR